MVGLRYAYLLALVFWLGGLLALGGLAAPAIFETLATAGGPSGREVAGVTVGAVLRRFHLAAYAAAAIMLASFGLMRAIGPRPVRFALRLGILLAMTATTLYSGLGVSRRVERLQRAIDGPVRALPDIDPRRIAFGRLHALSTLLMTMTAAGGFALLYWEAKAHD